MLQEVPVRAVAEIPNRAPHSGYPGRKTDTHNHIFNDSKAIVTPHGRRQIASRRMRDPCARSGILRFEFTFSVCVRVRGCVCTST
jgi:hypothetical protein